jgi:hypothetical protein
MVFQALESPESCSWSFSKEAIPDLVSIFATYDTNPVFISVLDKAAPSMHDPMIGILYSDSWSCVSRVEGPVEE